MDSRGYLRMTKGYVTIKDGRVTVKLGIFGNFIFTSGLGK